VPNYSLPRGGRINLTGDELTKGFRVTSKNNVPATASSNGPAPSPYDGTQPSDTAYRWAGAPRVIYVSRIESVGGDPTTSSTTNSPILGKG
jgi:hypothetical protein